MTRWQLFLYRPYFREWLWVGDLLALAVVVGTVWLCWRFTRQPQTELINPTRLV